MHNSKVYNRSQCIFSGAVARRFLPSRAFAQSSARTNFNSNAHHILALRACYSTAPAAPSKNNKIGDNKLQQKSSTSSTEQAMTEAPDMFSDIGVNETEIKGFLNEEEEQKRKGPLPCESSGGAAPPSSSSPFSSPSVPSSSRPFEDDAATDNNSTKHHHSCSDPTCSHPHHHHHHHHEHEDATTTAATTSNYTPPSDTYYESVAPANLNTDDILMKIRREKERFVEHQVRHSQPTDVDFLKMEYELKDEDPFHFRIGKDCIEDRVARRDYYVLHSLAVCLNKSRWKQIEKSSEKGQNIGGTVLRSQFWRDACHEAINSGGMPTGQFVQGHPIIRPFGEFITRRKPTRTFLRGFVDARLKVINQPGNVKQLFEYFDKFHGFFLTAQLSALGVRDDNAEHLLLHVGRALGLIQHCVLMWRHYARKNITLLPADVCADNCVDLQLLTKVRLASSDTAVRRALYDVCCYAKSEMEHARQLAPSYPTRAWPLLTEAFFPNYYLSFLLRHNFDVSKYHADENLYSPGFHWYCFKKLQKFRRSHDMVELLEEEAGSATLSKLLSFLVNPFGKQSYNINAEESAQRKSSSSATRK